jgi:hypothetical protein
MKHLSAAAFVLLLVSVAPGEAQELTVVSVSPTPNGMGPAAGPITITFDRAVKRPTVTSSSVRVFGRGTGTASGAISYSNADATVIFTPSTPLSAGELVTVNLANTLEGADDAPMRPEGYAFQFLIEVEPSLRTFDMIGVLSNRTNPGTGTRIYGAAATDLDNDDYLDLATVNEDSWDIRVFLNAGDGSGTFLEPFLTPEPIGQQASPNEQADFDNDGDTDLVVSATTTEDVWILLGQGDGTFGPPQSIDTGSEPHGVVALDVDGDADWDVVNAAVGSSDLALLINDGNGVFGLPAFFEGGVDGEYGLTTADMNSDGIIDLVVAARNGQEMNVMLGDGDGTFTQAMPVAQSSGGLSWVVVTGDVDGDGDMDAAVANSVSGNGAILRGNDDGTLDAPEIYNVGSHLPSVDLGDMDGDDDLDMVLSSYGGGFWNMYTNDGLGNFTFDQDFSAVSNPSCSILYDADNDGDLDMALTDEIADLVMLMENESTSSCAPTPLACREPTASAKASVAIQDRADPEKDQISFKWRSGAATTIGEFGNPTGSDDYALCIYDNDVLIYGADIPSGSSWSANSKGYKYRDKDLLPDGVKSVVFKESTIPGKASLTLKSKGAQVAPPSLAVVPGPVDVQVQRGDGLICFGATFTDPYAVHDLTQLKDKAD